MAGGRRALRSSLTWFALLAALFPVEGPAHADARVAAGVSRALANADARVRVVIEFDVPALARPSDAAPGSHARASAIAAGRDAALGGLDGEGVELVRTYRHVNVAAANVSAAGLAALRARAGVRRIDLDPGGGGHLNQAVPLAGLDVAQAAGLSGAGVLVAVLDSGYDSDHADLSDDLVAEACFCSGDGGCCPGGGASAVGPGSAEDDHGHGTNVTGIITSAGIMAAGGGAPDAGIVAVKVLDDWNRFCCTSDVIAGLDWVIDNRPDVDVVNMSLGTSLTFMGSCDKANAATRGLAMAIDTLRARGVPVFASSGNDGSGTHMSAPACVANAIAVGAVWDADVGAQFALGCMEPSTAPDQVACFSNSNGSTDLFAPGAITTSTGIGGAISAFRGTSQASPLAAACAALLLEDDPLLSAAEIESLLESSPTRVTDATNGLDFPRLDCGHALAVGPIDEWMLHPMATWAVALGLVGAGHVRRGGQP